MNDFDDRLRGALDRRAGRVDEQPDWDDLSDRLSVRDRPKNRLLVFALVLSLFAGPALGFVVGRAGADDDAAVVATGEPDTDSEESIDIGDTSPPPLVDSSGGDDSAASFEAPSGSTLLRAEMSHDGYSAYYGEPMAYLYARDVGATRIRVYRAATPAYESGVEWWDPPGYCFPTGSVQADVSTERAVGIGYGSTFAELRAGAVHKNVTVIGYAEGEPAWIVVAQVPPDTARVRATFTGGATDETEPVDGIAVLYSAAGGNDAEGDVKVEAVDASGAVIAQSAAPDSEFAGGSPECRQPTTLPAPGAEQPADPAAARAEIEALFGTRWDEETMEARLAKLDDPRGMREVYEQLENGSFGTVVRSARTTLNDLVFLSPTRGATLTSTALDGYPPDFMANQLGEVTLVDGAWKLSRESVCRSVQAGGVTCPEVE